MKDGPKKYTEKDIEKLLEIAERSVKGAKDLVGKIEKSPDPTTSPMTMHYLRRDGKWDLFFGCEETGHSESAECWCQPKIQYSCLGYDGNKCDPSCWRCKGKGWIEECEPGVAFKSVLHQDKTQPVSEKGAI